MDVVGNAVHKRAPALSAYRGVFGKYLIGNSAVGKNFVDIGCFGLVKKAARTVNADNDNVLIGVIHIFFVLTFFP